MWAEPFVTWKFNIKIQFILLKILGYKLIDPCSLISIVNMFILHDQDAGHILDHNLKVYPSFNKKNVHANNLFYFNDIAQIEY